MKGGWDSPSEVVISTGPEIGVLITVVQYSCMNCWELVEQYVGTCQVEPDMEGISWAIIYQVWSWNGQWFSLSWGSLYW